MQLGSSSYQSAVLFPRMLGVSEQSICLHSLFLGDQRQPSQQTSWAPNVFLATTWLPLPSILHPGPDLPAAMSYFPGGPSHLILSRDTAKGCIAWIWAILKNSNHNMASLLRFSHHKKKIWGWRTKYETGSEWEKWGEAAIMTQNQSCCRAPHKNYSRRNGTWPGGKSAPPSAGLALAQSGHSLVWCPPPIRLVCSLLSHSKVI